MKKIIALLIVIPALLFAGLFTYVLVNGPRMTVQHNFRDYQRIMPPPAGGTVPVIPSAYRLPSPAESARLTNPVRASARDLTRGRIYYHYYCGFCHGESGAGDGPVGQSYAPRPADLRQARVSGLGDGGLLRAMLTGIGHEPVLERVVPPEHRWHLVLFVRSLGADQD